MSTKATVHHVPYTAESASPVPRTTAEERAKWQWAAKRDYYLCREVEPEDSWRNRVFWRTLGVEGRKQASQDTREEIRSQPDYDGPPMRAPSGVQYHWRERADGSRNLTTPLRVSEFHLLGPIRSYDLATHFGGVEESSDLPKESPADEMSTYRAPSAGGRGWCPILAGVRT